MVQLKSSGKSGVLHKDYLTDPVITNFVAWVWKHLVEIKGNALRPTFRALEAFISFNCVSYGYGLSFCKCGKFPKAAALMGLLFIIFFFFLVCAHDIYEATVKASNKIPIACV